VTAPRARTVRGLAVLGGGTALAAVLGLGFQSLLAYWFGASAETDAFFMSLSIYGFLGKFLMLSHLRSLALPVYARLRGSDPERARRLAGGLLGVTVAGVAVISVVLLAAAPVLVDLLAPGYDGAMRDLTVLLVRIRIPALLFLAGTTVAMAFLESEQRFGVTISAQKIVPAAVALALLLVVANRHGIEAVAWVGLLSTVAGALLILPMARDRLGSPALGAAARDPEIRSIGARWTSLSSSNAATFVGEWAFRVGASLLPVGLFSAVLYGRMVHDLLHGAINDSAQTMALPRFSAAIAAGAEADPPKSSRATDAEADPLPSPRAADARVAPELGASLTALTALSLPLTLLVATTTPWIVALLFGRGRFLADGMLGPAAVSLSLFMIGFFLQGLVQILFSAAFATHRSDLINRTQLVGHLARAAALVPMVMWLSYVGLVGAQVAMNALVLGLLVLWAPREWGLRSLPRRLLRPLVAAVIPAVVFVSALSPRLPDPLSLGTGGRVAALAAIGAGWLLVYGALAAALRLPEAEAVVRRVRRRAVTAAGAVLVCSMLPGRAHAQTPAGWSPVGEGHWTLSVLEWMEARGELPVGASAVRPLPAARVAEMIGAAELGERFGEERGASNGLSASVGLRLRGDDGGTALRSLVRIDAGSPSSLPFGFVELDRWSVLRGGVGVRAGKLWAVAARERVQLGGGATGSIVLNPSARLDGVSVGTAEPLSLPVLGAVSLIAGAGPLGRYEAVDDPWWGYVRATSRPTPWLQIGGTRGVLAGGHFGGGTVAFDAKPYGPDARSMSAGDVVRLIFGANTGFDDQVFAVDVRTAWSGLGAALVTYAELGWDDADRSWGDPGLIAGALWAPTAPWPITLRYEYVAFGSSARWCGWCDTLPAFWYQHVRFQSGWRAGPELLGHPLGGYGRQHAVSVSSWSPDGRIRAEMGVASLDRERWNLLEDERPGSATSFELETAWRGRPWLEVAGEIRDERGRGWKRRMWAVSATGFF
jgi:peptidoglycan biosynthesis protein MviN/MurJ (putative lipid II flippase)